MLSIDALSATEILGSRGRPTLAVSLGVGDGRQVSAGVPSGASTGSREARERRDGDPARFGGAGVLGAVSAVDGEIADLLCGRSWASRRDLDSALVAQTGNPDNQRGIAHVEVMVGGAAVPAGVDLVDTPGTGSLHLHNTATAEEALRTADTAIFVTGVDPPLSASEAELLRETTKTAVHTLVVVNKVDRLAADERDVAVDYVRGVVARQLDPPPPVLPLSVTVALRAQREADAQALADSGLPALREALGPLLGTGRLPELLASLSRRARDLAAGRVEETALTVAALRLPEDELTRRRGEVVRRLAGLRQEEGRQAQAWLAARLAELRAETDAAVPGLAAATTRRLL